MSDDSLLFMVWHATTDTDPPMYMLLCESDDPMRDALRVEIAADQVTERAARAKLIEQAFLKARELHIDTSRLRFHV